MEATKIYLAKAANLVLEWLRREDYKAGLLKCPNCGSTKYKSPPGLDGHHCQNCGLVFFEKEDK